MDDLQMAREALKGAEEANAKKDFKNAMIWSAYAIAAIERWQENVINEGKQTRMYELDG